MSTTAHFWRLNCETVVNAKLGVNIPLFKLLHYRSIRRLVVWGGFT